MAVTRGWSLWTDDGDVVKLLGVLHPRQPIERISDLLDRAVREELVACEEAADLYNLDFKATLNLWTTLTASCHQGILAFR